MSLGTLVAALWLAQASPAPPEAAPPVTPPAAPAPQALPPAPSAAPTAPEAQAPAPPAAPQQQPTPGAAAPPPGAAPFPPPPRRGFQGALSLQAAFPVGGRVQGDTHVRDLVQVVFELEAQAGAKITPRVFLGGYLGGGWGAPGKDTVNACHDFDRTCTATSVRGGLLARYDVTPGDAGNLWVGAGLGGQRQDADVAARTNGGIVVDRAKLTGWELRILAGVDYRASRAIGFGLFGAVSIGSVDVDLPGGTTASNVATTWFTVGARGVLFP